jgi:hypothetical protein
MGRLIDADVLREEVYSWGMNDYEPSDFTDAIDDAPTVEAIPKAEYEEQIKINNKLVNDNEQLRAYITMMQADYKARLRADMAAMLAEIQLECEENTVRWYVGRVDGKSDDVVLIDTLNKIIEQKINALKEN